MARFYLGIDGGQSSTKALLADETGLVIGRGYGGPCNHAGPAEGRAKFLSAVGDCLRQASGEAGFDPATPLHFASVCLGLSGGSEDKQSYARELILSKRYKFTHDAEIALTGGTAGEPGIVVIAGTGSIAFGKNGQMKTARAGGWGYIFGDEGGAFDLVRRALRAALQYEEGWGPPTHLLKVLLELSSSASANVLLHSFYNSFDRTRIATYARHVSDAAEEGDQVALEVLNEAAAALNRLVEGVYRQLFLNGEVVSIVQIGGVFKSIYLRNELKRLVNKTIGCPLLQPRFIPAAGALIEALRADGNLAPLSGLEPAG